MLRLLHHGLLHGDAEVGGHEEERPMGHVHGSHQAEDERESRSHHEEQPGHGDRVEQCDEELPGSAMAGPADVPQASNRTQARSNRRGTAATAIRMRRLSSGRLRAPPIASDPAVLARLIYSPATKVPRLARARVYKRVYNFCPASGAQTRS